MLGLDPDPAKLWPGAVREIDAGGAPGDAAAEAAEAVAAHCRAAIEAAGPSCVAVKPQLACFERLGAPGWAALHATRDAAHEAGLLVLADGKRGDVPVTAAAYAQALVGSTPTPYGPVQGLGADCFTVNPLLGRDSLEPLVDAAAEHGAGVFALVSTSNPGAADLQDLDAGGRPLHEHVAALVDDIGSRPRGRVRPVAGRRRHRRHPARAPGAPARADAARDLPAARRGRPGRRPGGAGRRLPAPPGGGLVTASRSIVNAHADRGGDPGGGGARRGTGTADDHLGALAAYSPPRAPSGATPAMAHQPSRSPVRLLAPIALVLTFLRVRVRRPQLARVQRRRARVRHLDPAEVGHPGQHDPRSQAQAGHLHGKAGDNLGSIAEKTQVPIETLQELNPELDPQALVSGQKIKLKE